MMILPQRRATTLSDSRPENPLPIWRIFENNSRKIVSLCLRSRCTPLQRPSLGEFQLATFVSLLSREQVERLPERAREVVEYRKSGLSLNHVQGCPLGCAYCIRHIYGLWDQRQPRALMSDAEAVNELVGHRYFQPHVTPVQVFNRATDPFLPNVRPHTFAVLEDLDQRGLTNHALVITGQQMKPEDGDRLNELRHIKVTLLFTYSFTASPTTPLPTLPYLTTSNPRCYTR